MYRRTLPHIAYSDEPYYVTWRTKLGLALSPAARDIVFKSILYEHKKQIELLAAVVMSTHIHILFIMNDYFEEKQVTLATVLNRIKGPSSHRINRLLGRKGALWQSEAFDRLTRSDADVEGKLFYIISNPVEARLVRNPTDYKWLWVADWSNSKTE